MNKMMRKPGRPIAFALALGIIGALALLAAVAVQPNAARAQEPTLCDSPIFATLPICTGDVPTPTTPPDGGTGGTSPAPDDMDPTGDKFSTGSTSASAGVEVKVTINNMPMNAEAGSSIELYLEDDFQVPDDIDRDNVYFTVTSPRTASTNSGGRVYVSDPIEIDDADHFGGDDDWSIRVYIPDMNTSDVDAAAGYQGPVVDQTVTLVFTKAAGIKNPSEAGTHSAAYRVLDANGNASGSSDAADDVNDANDDGKVTLPTSTTVAKIGLSDEDNSRGYSLTVTGSGFNNGTSAGVYVLNRAPMGDTDEAKCEDIIRNGANPGSATVDSDDKAAVTFEVTVPTFMAGTENYICMMDGEGRMSHTDIEQFKLEPSIRVVPSTVSAGDTVNVFAQDFPTVSAGFVNSAFKLAGRTEFNDRSITVSGDGIGRDHAATATFEVPGGLKGTIRVDAAWGVLTDGKCTSPACISEDAKITIAPSELTLSKDEVNANESVTIRGSGFGTGGSDGCLTSATMSGAKLMLISRDSVAGSNCIPVEVSSGGQFAATVVIWTDGADNPALTAGTHTIEVTDNQGFTGAADVVIKEPTLTVTPEIAGPRDYITISGENWPVDNEDGANIDDVEIEINFGSDVDDEDGEPDAAGRWSTTYRVDGDVIIPSTVQLKATYGDSSEIVKVGSFSVPAANLTVTPERVSPGETITLSATGFSLFESEIEVKIGNVRVNVPDGTVTDREGAIDGLEIIVPSLDPALYTVQLNVGDPATVTIGEVTIVEEGLAGVPSELPEALSGLGDNLVAVFYWNDATKQWHFFDPRPEWAELNTLSELVNGQAYWILVSDNQDNVVLNGKNRSLTCAGGSCWNLEVW